MEVAMEKHAEAAQDEIAQLIDEFMLLVDHSGLFTPNIQFLVSQFRLRTPALPDGSRTIRLHWEGVILPILMLIFALLVLVFLLQKNTFTSLRAFCFQGTRWVTPA